MSYPPGPYEGSPEWQGQQPPPWQGQPAPGWPPPQPGWPAQREPDNYLVWAILCTILCCVPLGIVSLVQSSKVSGLWAQGRFAEAQAASDGAKKWAIIGAVVGAVFWVMIVMLYVFLGILGLAVSHLPSTTTTTFSGF
jgi:Interferon-induced transmembrane protein